MDSALERVGEASVEHCIESVGHDVNEKLLVHVSESKIASAKKRLAMTRESTLVNSKSPFTNPQAFTRTPERLHSPFSTLSLSRHLLARTRRRA